MLFLANAGGSGSSSGVEFWAAVISLATALVVTAGPAIVRKLFPPDHTISDIAKTSTTRIADTLDATLALVRDDVASARQQLEDNGRKLDAIGAKLK